MYKFHNVGIAATLKYRVPGNNQAPQRIIKIVFLTSTAITAKKDGSNKIKNNSDIYFLIKHLIAIRVKI